MKFVVTLTKEDVTRICTSCQYNRTFGIGTIDEIPEGDRASHEQFVLGLLVGGLQAAVNNAEQEQGITRRPGYKSMRIPGEVDLDG